jgi:hypothetical protein
MATKTDEFIALAAQRTGDRMAPVAAALTVLVKQSWPKPEVVRAFARAESDPTTLGKCKAILSAFEVAHSEYPTAVFWWKTEKSEFLGFCPRFAAASGVPALDLLGRTDADPLVTWNRQAPIYMRDDREVMLSRTPRFDIVERQDRGEATVWLRTSKVPYESAWGSGTVGGFDTISASLATQLARKRA